MGIEIDFLPVGEESKSGDAILLRYGDLHGSRSDQTVVLVDGGFADNAEGISKHLGDYYHTGRIDIVIVTHPDQDHVSGLKTILEEVQVGELWMHLPWNHSADMKAARKSAFLRERLSDVAKASLQDAEALDSIATRRGIPIVEPFLGVGTADGVLQIVGPTQEYYEELLPQVVADARQAPSALAEMLKRVADSAMSWAGESLDIETLTDAGETSPVNNTSVITLIQLDGKKHLLTGDAGMPALERALDVLEPNGFAPGFAKFVQIPHHGSRRNVGPTVLNRLLGEKGQAGRHSVAFVSVASKGEPKHPSKKVTNAFHRRGYDVKMTQGSAWRHRQDAPDRTNYAPGESVPFYDEVEDEG